MAYNQRVIVRYAWSLSALLGAVLAVGAPSDGARDRRIVDTVHAGDARSEAAHGFAGHDTHADTAGGAAYREARGWMRYALTTFDDTEVTVSCTFAPDTASAGTRHFALVVEDSVIATPTLTASVAPRTVDVLVPQRLTRGRTNIAIVIRADGGTTPALRQLRTVQDHNEYVPLVPLGAPR